MPTKLDSSAGLLRLKESARRGELVAVIGTGVSLSLTNNKTKALSWKGLVLDGFAHGVTKGKITPAQASAWRVQLDSSDLDDLLAAAEFMSRKLDAPNGALYARWLENVFKMVEPTNKSMVRSLVSLQAAGIPFCTLNYDWLLERVTGLSTLNLRDVAKTTEWMRRQTSGILHLHGSWDDPASCILGIRDYSTAVTDEVRDLVQRSLSSFRRLLFVGCGDTFADPNFAALITWLRTKMKTAVLEHYALVTEDQVATRHADPAWQGFVEPISFGVNHSELPDFLLTNFRDLKAKKPANMPRLSERAQSVNSAHLRLVEDYCSFLIRDCGQMTIEGVRADLETAQRRFDLERLFVPLEVSPTPPEIPTTDPERERKLLEWEAKNRKPRPFGEIFAEQKRLALLALPGGGKTILLKRIAVAYADPTRRRNSADSLPDLALIPVLLRCRDWREHVHRPLPTLFASIPEIVGQPSLVGLWDALLPLFKKGRIILLVDGLDEIHDDARRATFVENLESFLV